MVEIVGALIVVAVLAQLVRMQGTALRWFLGSSLLMAVFILALVYLTGWRPSPQ